MLKLPITRRWYSSMLYSSNHKMPEVLNQSKQVNKKHVQPPTVQKHDIILCLFFQAFAAWTLMLQTSILMEWRTAQDKFKANANKAAWCSSEAHWFTTCSQLSLRVGSLWVCVSKQPFHIYIHHNRRQRVKMSGGKKKNERPSKTVT